MPSLVAPRLIRHAVLPMVMLMSLACTRRMPLEVSSLSDPVPGLDDAAQTQTDGLHVLARVDAWRGSADILDDVTPVWVQVTNTTDKPVAVRYADFSLDANDGSSYLALPPFATEGSASMPLAYGPGYPGYYGAPYSDWRRGRLMGPAGYPYSWVGPVGYYDYGYYYDSWVEVPLPTPRMVELALPEGTIAPGASASGFLYFERVDDDDDGMVDLRYQVTDAKTNQRFAVAIIPFAIDDVP